MTRTTALETRPRGFWSGFRRGSVEASLVAPVPLAASLAWNHHWLVAAVMLLPFVMAIWAWRTKLV